jgi:ribonuclease P protein component
VKIKNRIKKDRDFKRIIAKKRILRDDFFVIYYDWNETQITRVGVSVSKKHGGAVKRNRIRRQIKAMLSDILSFKESVDLIVITRNDYDENQFHENKSKLKELIKKTLKK